MRTLCVSCQALLSSERTKRLQPPFYRDIPTLKRNATPGLEILGSSKLPHQNKARLLDLLSESYWVEQSERTGKHRNECRQPEDDA